VPPTGQVVPDVNYRRCASEIRLRSGYITFIFKAIRRTPNRLIRKGRRTNTTSQPIPPSWA
jgi:hypothetical protein